jgi:hypothetical protein
MKLLCQATARPTRWFYFAPSALNGLLDTPPGALPQAITFRAFGAFKPTGQAYRGGNSAKYVIAQILHVS